MWFNDLDDEVLNEGIDVFLVGVGGFLAGQNDQHMDKLDDSSQGKK